MGYEQEQNEYGETGGIKVSRYNSALFINLAISRLWKDATDHARSGQYHKWNSDLDMLWGELGGDLDEDTMQGKKLIDKYNSITKELSDVGSLFPPSINGFESPPQDYYDKKAKQYSILLKKHLFLKHVQNAQGKGTAYKTGSEDDWD